MNEYIKLVTQFSNIKGSFSENSGLTVNRCLFPHIHYFACVLTLSVANILSLLSVVVYQTSKRHICPIPNIVKNKLANFATFQYIAGVHFSYLNKKYICKQYPHVQGAPIKMKPQFELFLEKMKFLDFSLSNVTE